MTKNVLLYSLGYLALGVGVAGYSVYLYTHEKPRFEGIGESSPLSALLQTVLLWPYALVVNVRG